MCGLGKKLQKRLARADKCIHLLDAACREHDIAYSKSKDIDTRQADRDQTLSRPNIAEKTWQRVKSKESDFKERRNACLMLNAMKAKVKYITVTIGIWNQLINCNG